MKKVYAQNCFVDEKMDVIPNVSMFWVKMWCQTLLRGCSRPNVMFHKTPSWSNSGIRVDGD
jgi:hypothetical protein